jgi:hypothetical protein
MFVRSTPLFPGDERLIAGCKRLLRIALEAGGPRGRAERDRIATSALWGLRWLGAETDIDSARALVHARGDLVEAEAWIREHAPAERKRK